MLKKVFAFVSAIVIYALFNFLIGVSIFGYAFGGGKNSADKLYTFIFTVFFTALAIPILTFIFSKNSSSHFARWFLYGSIVGIIILTILLVLLFTNEDVRILPYFFLDFN